VIEEFSMATFSLAGSERQPVAGARATAPADPSERLEVSVLVRRRAGVAFGERVSQVVAGAASQPHLEREEFAQQFGADAADFAKVRSFAVSHGLAVVQEDAARRTIVLSGKVTQFSAAFGVKLEQFEYDAGTYRGRTGAIQLPDELKGVVEAVLGLDNRPQAKPHFRIRETVDTVAARAAATTSTTFTPTQLAALYDFPSGKGAGQCIAIIELGGGFRPTDLQTYFGKLGITAPSVSAVSVDHAKNSPTGSANGPDGEVMLDIEVVGAIAPEAKIVVYFAPNTDAGFLDAITTAVHDAINKPSVVSISWGGAESTWTQQAMTAYDDAFQAAATMGVTVCAASGDNGSNDGVDDGNNHVDFPASSPNVLGCGGTSVQVTNGKITKEVVWNDGASGGAGGGGVSSFFAMPVWQKGLKVSNSKGTAKALTKRGVPDVAGDADPQTGYTVRVDGKDLVFGGTSAVAPLWAGLVARINANKGSSIGYINAKLYRHPQAFTDIAQGNNGSYSAAAGWDACTGLGSPDGKKIGSVV
jgi:kumamolisin